MAGSITVSSITLDSDNNFSIRSNTGATILSANGTGLITGIASGSSITNAQLTTPTVSGNAAFDTNTLFVDATNDRVGIGTSTPAYTFDVTTSTTVLGRFQSTHSTGGYLYFQASGTTPTATGYIGAASKLNSGGANTDFGMTAVTNLVFGTNDGTERMRIDSSGRVTTPFQPGIGIILVDQVFSAATSGFYKPTTYTTTYNVGGGFNPTGGPSSSFRYTAPIAGRYFIQWSVMGNDGGNRLEVCVLKNGGDFMNGDTNTSKYANAIVASIQYLAASDYLDFRINQGDYYSGVNSIPCLSIHLIG
jgi:hypothetical protein